MSSTLIRRETITDMCGWWSLSHYHRRFITSEPSALIYKYELDIASSITERREINRSLMRSPDNYIHLCTVLCFTLYLSSSPSSALGKNKKLLSKERWVNEWRRKRRKKNRLKMMIYFLFLFLFFKENWTQKGKNLWKMSKEKLLVEYVLYMKREKRKEGEFVCDVCYNTNRRRRRESWKDPNGFLLYTWPTHIVQQ
jgi:hypothetical protein